MFRNMKLGIKLLVAFLTVGVVPFAVTGVLSLRNASQALTEKAYGQLEGLRGIKKARIENFFAEIKRTQVEDYFRKSFVQMGVFARSTDVSRLYEALVQHHRGTKVSATDNYFAMTTEYKRIYGQLAASLNQFQKDRSYGDKLMRSDSLLDPVHHTIKASFADPSRGRVDTGAARKALAGQSGADVIVNCNGNPVLSSYAPLTVGDTTWGHRRRNR